MHYHTVALALDWPVVGRMAFHALWRALWYHLAKERLVLLNYVCLFAGLQLVYLLAIRAHNLKPKRPPKICNLSERWILLWHHQCRFVHREHLRRYTVQ